jgi:1-acyl-sn-glycerol-3-phosphate acyltransferase
VVAQAQRFGDWVISFCMAHGKTATWQAASLWDLWRWPLPYQAGSPINRVLNRLLVACGRHRIIALSGWEQIAPQRDPFILVPNHNMKLEAILLPTLLVFLRRGRLIHFLADWSYGLIPGVGSLYRRGGVIPVTRKSARPAFLNVLKPLWADPMPALERARHYLLQGRSIGLFPEGRVNHDPNHLLPGRAGAARLSLETGAPVIPVGIRFPHHDRSRPIDDRARMYIQVGAPLQPPAPGGPGRAAWHAVREWHACIMSELASLSGKAWKAETSLQR